MKGHRFFAILPLVCLSALAVLLMGAAPEKGVRSHPLVWDAMEKTVLLEPGETNATFSFWVTNTSKGPVIIVLINPSCGRTVTDYPMPWRLRPGESGELIANMNVAGEKGLQVKTLTVQSGAGPSQELTIKANIPVDPNEERRARNMAAAAKDRQVVFRGDCASCHVEPSKGKLGKDLFDAGCNICHNPPTGHRAEIVPDLTKLAFPTTKDYWRKMIADGKEGTLMPGFATAHGGPLTDEEIESLAEYAVKAFPFDPANVQKATKETN